MTMILKVLFVQRVESYAGQFAPEAVHVVDEFTYDENPQGFQERCDTIIDALGDEIVGHEILEIKVDQQAVRNRVLHLSPPLSGILL